MKLDKVPSNWFLPLCLFPQFRDHRAISTRQLHLIVKHKYISIRLLTITFLLVRGTHLAGVGL